MDRERPDAQIALLRFGSKDRQGIPWMLEGTASHPQAIDGAKCLPDMGSIPAAGKQSFVEFYMLPHLVHRSIAKEFDPKALHTQLQKIRHRFGTALRHAIEEGVAATDIGMQHMFNPQSIA